MKSTRNRASEAEPGDEVASPAGVQNSFQPLGMNIAESREIEQEPRRRGQRYMVEFGDMFWEEKQRLVYYCEFVVAMTDTRSISGDIDRCQLESG